MSCKSYFNILRLTNVIFIMAITKNYINVVFQWSGRRDSNPLPTAWEAVALPGELLPLL